MFENEVSLVKKGMESTKLGDGCDFAKFEAGSAGGRDTLLPDFVFIVKTLILVSLC